MKNPVFEALFEKHPLLAYSWNLADIFIKVGLVGAAFSIFSTLLIVVSCLGLSAVAFISKVLIFKYSGLDYQTVKSTVSHKVEDNA